MCNDAVEKLGDYISKFWYPVPDVWPFVAEIRKDIMGTLEYTMLELQYSMKKNYKGLSLQQVVNGLIQRTCCTIEERWASRESHNFPSIELLKLRYDSATKRVIDDESNTYIRYFPENVLLPETDTFYRKDFVKWFYWNLQNTVAATLYADSKIFLPEELGKNQI